MDDVEAGEHVEPITEVVPEGDGESVPTALEQVVERLGERVAALESKIVEAPPAAVEHIEHEPVVEEPPPVVVDHVIEKSPLQRFHEAIG